MSRRGENIYKRKDNRWEGRYKKGHDSQGKTRFGYVYAKTYREAREKLNLCKQEAITNSTPSKKRFGDFCDEWLVLSRSRVKESTYVKYHTMVTNHIKPKLGRLFPNHLNTVGIEGFSHDLLMEGLSVKTVRDILTVLRSVLKYCRRQIGPSFPDIEIVYPKERKKEMRVLTLEEQTKLIQYLLREMDAVKFGVLLALLTGMRIGEVCALQWKDISTEDKTIHIRSTMQRLQTLDDHSDTKTRIVIGDAKSQASDRIIPLTEYAAKLCKSMDPKNDAAYILTGDAQHSHDSAVILCQLQTQDPNAVGVVINGGTFDGKGAASVIANIFGNVIVNDGEFNAHYDGEYSGECVYVDYGNSYVPSITTINGGTFNADKRIFYVSVNTNYTQKIVVTGGTFNVAEGGSLIQVSSGNASDYLTITGGTFNVDPSAYVDTANYDITNSGSTWTVTAK